MAKISPVAAKYIIHSTINIEGVVDRPDVIGAIFGQTEGLLGNDLELRELQRSGRIGRIEVNINISSGKTAGEIIIPSSLDKTETAIVAAALEIIQRIGPCNAKIAVEKIEDVRTSKRQFVIDRAKELLRNLTDLTLPDSQELADEVAQSVRMMEVSEYGREKLAAGPAVEESEEIVIVEGRADVLNLLKHGFKNAIAMNGTSCPQTIKELSRKKSVTVFVDGDRGGDLIIRELLSVADIDFVSKAPDGKEVEELAKKEIHKCLRGRITAEQAKLEMGIDKDGALRTDNNNNGNNNGEQNGNGSTTNNTKKTFTSRSQGSLPNRIPSSGPGGVQLQRKALNTMGGRMNSTLSPRPSLRSSSAPKPFNSGNETDNDSPALNPEEKKVFKETMEDLFGTRGACIFDQSLNILGKVPVSELSSTIKSLNGGIYAIAMDGAVEPELVYLAEKLNVIYLIGTGSKFKESTKINVLTDDKLMN